jgi:hypothetical protein
LHLPPLSPASAIYFLFRHASPAFFVTLRATLIVGQISSFSRLSI